MSATPHWTTTAVTADLLRGALDVAPAEHGVLPLRLPAGARAQADGQLNLAQSQPAGVRLAFRSRATAVELDAHRTALAFKDVQPRPDGRYDLVVNGELVGQAVSADGTAVIIDLATGTTETRPGPAHTVQFTGLSGEDKDVEIWLPHYERIELISLRTNAPVEPMTDRARPIWMHHGSSISQGSNAASPATTWTALAARHADVDLINLGFSGSAMLDQSVARTMRDQAADLISVKIGINLVNGDVMRLRAFTPAVHGFLDTIRDGHPRTPLLVISPLCCPMHEDTPGPAGPDFADGTIRYRASGDPADAKAGKLTLRTIRDELSTIVAQRSADDPHLHLLDGRELYGESDHVDLPLPDRLHPDAATHELIAQRFTAHAWLTSRTTP